MKIVAEMSSEEITTFEVVGERLKFQAEQNELLQAKIEQMKAKYEPI